MAQDISMELLRTKLYLFNFKDACEMLANCNMDANIDFITEVILKYSVLIYGLSDCAEEDVPLAVYLFIEDVFGVSAKLELCVRYVDDDGASVMGVVLDSIITKHKIMHRSSILEGTEMRILPNANLSWILDGFCED